MPERNKRYIIEKDEPLYFTDYYTWRSDYDYFFWPVGIMAFLFFFIFLFFLGVNTEDQIYLDLIVIFVIMIFFVAVVVMFCLYDEHYQTRKASDSLSGRSIDRLKSLQVRDNSNKRDKNELI